MRPAAHGRGARGSSIDAILSALGYLLEPSYWFAVVGAVLLAAIAGLIPGVNSFLLMALSIPYIVFRIDDPAIGLVMQAAITGVDNTLDSIPAVLLGQPGAATQVTFLEGHQLARRGEAARTLGAVYAVSAMGGLVGAAALTAAIPVVRPFVLKFGFPEIGAMGLIGIAMVSVLSRGAMAKGLAAAAVGMLLASIGTDPLTGSSRLTIGPLVRLPLIPFALGLFALPEMIDLTLSRRPVAPRDARISTREVFIGARIGLSRWPMVIRQSLFGVVLGAIPGVGSAVIDWLAYAFGIFFTKDKSEFGKGSLDGVLFAESAQNAKEGGQAIPTLAMGVPGGPTWVIVLVGMMAYGVAPGPQMLGQFADITILLVITLAIGNLLITAIGLFVTGQLAKLTLIPYPVIGAVVIPLLLLSTFIDTTSWRGVQVALVVGALGLVMKHYGWPRPPMLLGFILAPIIELNILSGVNLHGWDGIVRRPVFLTIVAVATVAAVLLFRAIHRMEQAQALTDGTADRKGSLGGLRWRRWEHLFPLALIVVSALFIEDARDYRGKAPWFPTSLSLVVIALSALVLWRQVRGTARETSIMDLGMTSAGLEGMRRASMRMLTLFGAFVLVGITLGIWQAALVFAVGTPLLMLRGLGRWPLAVVTGFLVWLFIFAVLNSVLFVIYPEPFLTEWILNRFR